jgi:hypothetical protein
MKRNERVEKTGLILRQRREKKRRFRSKSDGGVHIGGDCCLDCEVAGGESPFTTKNL